MKNNFVKFLIAPIFAMMFVCAANAATPRADLLNSGLDTGDPLFFGKKKDLLSKTDLGFNNEGLLKLEQSLSYNVFDRLSLGLGFIYEEDFNGYDDGFSSFSLNGTYRMSDAGDKMTYDILFGMDFLSAENMFSPAFDGTIYTVGVRGGYNWSYMTLAITGKSSWLFDEINGMSFIDITPEAYFRITNTWTGGFGFNIRKSTSSLFDEQSVFAKLGARFGRTQYFGYIDYNFEKDENFIGGKINVLF